MKQKNKYSCRIKRKLSHAFKKKKKKTKRFREHVYLFNNNFMLPKHSG